MALNSTASIFAKADALIEHLRREKVLLILDGVEPLQNKDGDLRDVALKALIQELAVRNAGMVLITTRVELTDLPQDRPKVFSKNLDDLQPADGAKYLAHLKVQGPEDEREQASEEYGNHALALTLLGTYLTTFCNADIRRRDEIQDLQSQDTRPGRHARRVMASYEQTYKGQPELGILKALGHFDRPAEPQAFTLVRPKLEHKKYHAALNQLHKARLILKADPTQPLDCHPLIREHFSPYATQEGHALLYDHYKTQAKHWPDTLEEMTPLLYAVYHGCQADQHQAALDDVYYGRIHRGNQAYLAKKLGGFGTNLSLLASFFETPWTQPAATLTVSDQSLLIGQAGFTLRALGRLADAVEPIRAGAEAGAKQKHWKNAAIGYGNLSELHLALGNIVQAIEAARQSVEFANRSGAWDRTMLSRTILADALHQSGTLTESSRLFQEAERLQTQSQAEYQMLYSVRGYQYCDLLLAQGQTVEVLRRASQTLAIAIEQFGPLDIGLDHLSLGRAYPAGSPEAANHLNQAVDSLRRAGQLDYIPLGLLARGTSRDLDEVLRIATRSGMRLHLADYHLISARNAIKDADKTKARDHFAQAETLVNQTGYHRRDPELAALRLQLGI